MTEQHARQVQIGDTVLYRGQSYAVGPIRTTGMAPPYFRLAGVGLVSYHLCALPTDAPDPNQVADDARQAAMAAQMRTADGAFLEPQEPPF